MTLNVGDHIRVQRDEKLFPSRGTWPKYRGKTGYVCIVSEGGGRGDDPEYGVVLTIHRPPWRKEHDREHELSYDSEALLWFAPYELVLA